MRKIEYGIINLVRTQNFPKNFYFLPPDTHTYVVLSGVKRYKFFGKFCVRTKSMSPTQIKQKLPTPAYRNNGIKTDVAYRSVVQEKTTCTESCKYVTHVV